MVEYSDYVNAGSGYPVEPTNMDYLGSHDGSNATQEYDGQCENL